MPTTRRPFTKSAGGGLGGDTGVEGPGCRGGVVVVRWGATEPSLLRSGAGLAETPPTPGPDPGDAAKALAPLRVPTSRTPFSTGPAAISSEDWDASVAEGPRAMWRPPR